MLTLTYQDRDGQSQQLHALAFAISADYCLHTLDAEGERRFVGQLEQDRLNVHGEDWTRLEIRGLFEVRTGTERRGPWGAGISIGQANGEPKLYDRGGAGRTLAELGLGEVLICRTAFQLPRKARRLSALAS